MAKTKFPHNVDVAIPATGIGRDLTTLIGWCREHIPADDWDCHTHPKSQSDKTAAQRLRFYFVNEADAEALRRRWVKLAQTDRR
jgi:hypothetical protein